MFSLARVSLLIVALAAALGWAASFVGLHDYGVHQLYGFTDVTAWFIPGAIDGAAFATSLMTYRANIKGRAAIRGRLLMWCFTAASGWINWIHQVSPEARFVAAGLPVAAVAVFDVVLMELRADFEERHGRRAFRLRPGLLMLRYAVDKRGTSDAFRRQIEAIPVASLAGLGNDLLTDAARGGRIVPRQWLDLPQAKSLSALPAAEPAPAFPTAEPAPAFMAVKLPAEPTPPSPTAKPAPEPTSASPTVKPAAEPARTVAAAEPITEPSVPDESLAMLARTNLDSLLGESEPTSHDTDTDDDWTPPTWEPSWDYRSSFGDESSARRSTPEKSTMDTDRIDLSTLESSRRFESVPDQSYESRREREYQNTRTTGGDGESTTQLPTVRNEQPADEREAARELVRQNPEGWTGKSLGEKFGKSSSWGRTQIKQARQQLEAAERQRPKLVAVDS